MRYKQGITQTHIQNPELFKALMGGFLPEKKEQYQQMLARERVNYFIDFATKEKDVGVTSLMSMCLQEGPSSECYEVKDFRGRSKGFFDFQHVEIDDGANCFFFK
jgi:hypothetical protein